MPAVDSHYYAERRPEVGRFIPTHYTRVLEVGCARGEFRQNLAQNVEVWGIEPVPEAAAVARTRLNHVLNGTFEQVHGQLPENAFDLVICNDVIEHMADDAGFLRAIQRHMKPGGHIVGSIPNMRYWRVFRRLLFHREWNYEDEGVLDRTHLRFYTVKSFPRLLRANGFDVINFKGINGMRLRRRIPICLFSLGLLSDTVWLQFAFVARINGALRA